MAENERKDDNTGQSGGKSFDSAQDRRPKKLRVLLRTFGCQMNVRDSEVISGLLRAARYELTANPKEADVIIFNTCSVRQHAEEKVWSEIGRLSKLAAHSFKFSGGEPRAESQESRAGPIIGLVGCMAQNYKEDIFQRAPAVDFVAGPSDIHKIPRIIERIMAQQPRAANKNLLEFKIWETDSEFRPDEIYHTGFHEDKNHAFVVISEGCSNFCSYCVVPHVRGTTRHRGYKDILKEIQEALDQGVTKITLLGQNVNAYRYRDIDFIKLLKFVDAFPGLKEFSFITSHPKDTSLELFQGMRDAGKLRKYLHLPVQSGSDRILKLMNRGYTRKFYLDLADKYRKIVSNGTLTTDVIVGFPTETEEEFRESLELVKRTRFDAGFFFKYSPRPHTAAQNLPDDVPRAEKARRHALILGLQKEISRKQKAKPRNDNVK